MMYGSRNLGLPIEQHPTPEMVAELRRRGMCGLGQTPMDAAYIHNWSREVDEMRRWQQALTVGVLLMAPFVYNTAVPTRQQLSMPVALGTGLVSAVGALWWHETQVAPASRILP